MVYVLIELDLHKSAEIEPELLAGDPFFLIAPDADELPHEHHDYIIWYRVYKGI